VIVEPPIVLKTNISGIDLEVCHGEIIDMFRSFWFGPITKFELPDTQGTYYNFDHWLSMYRKARPNSARILLGLIKCN
jgi:hypothetical protein